MAYDGSESTSLFVGNMKKALSSSRLQERSLMVVEITSAAGIAVREKPSLLVNTICIIKKGVCLHVSEETNADNVQWLRISCGWIPSVGKSRVMRLLET